MGRMTREFDRMAPVLERVGPRERLEGPDVGPPPASAGFLWLVWALVVAAWVAFFVWAQGAYVVM
jgi:hypothetical protein